MKIVLSGVETNNKGAELMLYAILQEIERKWPEAEVYISRSMVLQGLDYVKTSLKLHFFPIEWLVEKTHINGFLRRMKLPLISGCNFVRGDYFFDGSGFLFSDHCKLWGTTPEWWESILKHQHRHGAKIVMLPQAFGPFETKLTQQALKVLNRYATIIMPRETVSYNYIKESGLVNMNKVHTFTDFTSLVEGKFPSQYEHLKGGICIIPNLRMTDKGGMSYDGYIRFLSAIAEEGKKSGYPVYLLNHEGPKDEKLCLRCRESLGDLVEAVTNLNGIEVKGLIASAHVVITSRFHGLASSLNSGVPSLATSWSHKYEELLKDYGLDGSYVLPLDNIKGALDKVKGLMVRKENMRVRQIIESKVPENKKQTRKMWDLIWNL